MKIVMNNYKRVIKIIVWLLIIQICFETSAAGRIDDYLKSRTDSIQEEENMAFGSDIILEENDKLANNILMSKKFEEIDRGLADQNKFLPAKNFLRSRKGIENSKVFQVIKILPKGAVLHAHDFSTASSEYIFNNITYRPHLYICEFNSTLKLKFFNIPNTECDWRLLSELRENISTVNNINKRIQQEISISEELSNPDEIWTKFLAIYDILPSLLTFKSVYEDYYYQWLQDLYDDKVMYLEFRTPLYTLYDLDGKKYEIMDTVHILKNISEKFVADHPDFVGAKIIYSVRRNVNGSKMDEYLKIAKQLLKTYPSFIAGFDMDGGENNENPLVNFAPNLLSLGDGIKFFFHAGETNWNGLNADINLIDAILLNATRIGHGFAIVKHPKILKLVKERNIAIEVNPISNQVLALVSDLRNHPANFLFAENYPVVVSCDNPSFWGSKGLSYDYYEAFMGLMSRNSDIRALKKLAMNSLNYSVMSREEKLKAFQIFDKQWKVFLSEINKMTKKDEEKGKQISMSFKN